MEVPTRALGRDLVAPRPPSQRQLSATLMPQFHAATCSSPMRPMDGSTAALSLSPCRHELPTPLPGFYPEVWGCSGPSPALRFEPRFARVPPPYPCLPRGARAVLQAAPAKCKHAPSMPGCCGEGSGGPEGSSSNMMTSQLRPPSIRPSGGPCKPEPRPAQRPARPAPAQHD